MAKVRICVDGKKPVYKQADDWEAVQAFLEDCGYGLIAHEAAMWATYLHKPGDEYALDDLHMRIECGIVDVFDVRTGEWISCPPEMEAFLADIDAVCRRHGMILAPNDAGASGSLVVRPYTYRNRDMVEMAKKDYDVTEIQKPLVFGCEWELGQGTEEAEGR